MHPITKTWRLLSPDTKAVRRLHESLQVPPLVAQLVLNRGIATTEEASRFLDAAPSDLHDANELPGVKVAAGRILKAIEAGWPIHIYGDYDVDGVTGSAILYKVLRLLGAKVRVYLPDRFSEGYGLNGAALKKIAKSGSKLVITVDCGITGLEEAMLARKLGLELIITDHHEIKDTLPDAKVLVHPRLPDTEYPFGYLSGSGVAFKLAWALAMCRCGGEKLTPELRELLLDGVALAALGTVADVVPLLGENRILVRSGLKRLADRAPLGLQALCEVAGLAEGAELRASDIAYRLAPRLNAAGRMGQAMLAVELLTTTSRKRARDLAQQLEQLNEKRQKLERETIERANELITKQKRGDDPALVLASRNWHGGIVGIVAGRLAEQYGRPCLVVTLPKSQTGEKSAYSGLAVGSGRSTPGFALHEALKACGNLLAGHGGHAQAAGFRLDPSNLKAFRERFCARVAHSFPEGMPAPELILDAELPLSAVTLGLLEDLDRLEPYGAGNRRPLFLVKDVRVLGEPRKVGQGERHLSFQVSQGPVTLKAISWNMAHRAEDLMSKRGKCCLAFTPKRNEWQGKVTVDLEVSDFQPGRNPRLGEAVPVPE